MAPVAVDTVPSQRAWPQAKQLVQAGFKTQVLLPSDADYIAREASYWSNNAKIGPACILRPNSAGDVASALKALVAADEKFAIRSGGHMQWSGANNIEGGVTIDLGLLNWTRFDEASETVELGPGGHWRDVYAELQQHGRVVSGGRDGNVGVGGLLLGGGKTFFTARRGFACDDVISYEVVLADGSIVTADAGHHKDLYQALKGGSNNFGIVTNFRMNAIKCDKIWGGLNFFPKQITPDAIQAMSDFVKNMPNDLDSNLLLFFTYIPEFKDVVIVAAFVQTAGVENAPAYDKWLELPAIMNTCKMTTVSAVVSEYAIAPQDYYDVFYTANFKNDHRIVTKATELHEHLVEELKAHIPNGDFITQALFQPLPKLYGERSAAAGGNMIGVQHQKEDGLLFVAVAMVRTSQQQDFVYPKIKAWVQELKNFATTIEGGGNLDWIYLNYADKEQDPLGCSGLENIARMRAVATKYDPEQVFQKLCPGGFKLFNVKA